jgi:hypothetical protein
MDKSLQAQMAFHLTGRSPEPPLEAIRESGLRPALLARYRDLARLRYDFPLVLVEPHAGGPFARSLTAIVNQLVRDIAPSGAAGEAMRRHLLRVERDIRRTVAEGSTGRLSELWAQAVARLAGSEEQGLRQVLAHAGQAAGVDGELVDCDEALPERLFTHAWRVVQREKIGRAREAIDALIVGLNDILRADFVGSEAGRRPEALRASVGTRQQGLFDFDAMARLLARGAPASSLSGARRERIERTLALLRSQRFFPAATAAPDDAECYEFRFDTCREVQQAFAERLPCMAELVAAMSIAELECDGRYHAARHDPYFAAFDAHSLSPRDLEIFPVYLVRLRNHGTGAAADSQLMTLLAARLPAKVLVESNDILEELSIGQEQFAFGVRSTQLASLAVGLNDAFVLQSPGANLLPLQERIRRGLSSAAPALFSIYSPAAEQAGTLSRYLASAAAMQSRAFPAFSYDPAAGADLASRFSLDDNPQPERDWPVTLFEYADASLQRVSDELAFTLADVVLADPRYAHHFARMPHGDWHEGMLPAADWLARPAGADDNRLPFVLAVDGNDELQRLIVDDTLLQATRRCLENWHRLQELGGVNNSHAARLLVRERAGWEEQKRLEIEALAGGPAPPTAEPVAETTAASVAEEIPAPEEVPARSPDEAWIETLRCSSCNECTDINDQMFAYDDNQQAYIRDLTAGTYRQLVEAAESCQLCIIHPGKPIDPGEPGLEELIERARAFQ